MRIDMKSALLLAMLLLLLFFSYQNCELESRNELLETQLNQALDQIDEIAEEEY